MRIQENTNQGDKNKYPEYYSQNCVLNDKQTNERKQRDASYAIADYGYYLCTRRGVTYPPQFFIAVFSLFSYSHSNLLLHCGHTVVPVATGNLQFGQTGLETDLSTSMPSHSAPRTSPALIISSSALVMLSHHLFGQPRIAQQPCLLKHSIGCLLLLVRRIAIAPQYAFHHDAHF